MKRIFKRSDKETPKLQKAEYEPDVVYLVQFYVSPIIRTISPFALKVETFLRLKKVKYEPVYSTTFSKKGQIPYIELNGEQIPDSNVIIDQLTSRGLAEPDDDVSNMGKAINHLVSITLENHTSVAGFLWRYGHNMAEFYDKLCIPFYPNTKGMKFFRYLQPIAFRHKARLHGLGRHTLEEVAQFSFQDLKAISTLLGDQPYFTGDSPTTIDCTIFGHLVQFVLIPMDIPQKKYIHEQCPNLEGFVERMKERLWPDWDLMCHGDCMEGKVV